MIKERSLKIFLCHASADKPIVRRLYRYLKRYGVQPWLDELDLIPGQDWQIEIPNAIYASDVIIVCLSKNSVDKEGYVQKEITYALDHAMEKPEGTIFIVPVKLEECNVPTRLTRYQWVDLYREDGRKRLMLGLNRRVAQLGSTIRPVIISAEITDKQEPDTAQEDTIENIDLKMSKEASSENMVIPSGHNEIVLSLPTQKKEHKKAPIYKLNFRKIGIFSIVILFLLFGFWGMNYVINNWPITSLATPTSQPPTKTATNTMQFPTFTSTHFPPTVTKTSTPLVINTPTTTPTAPVIIEATLYNYNKTFKVGWRENFTAHLSVNGVDVCDKDIHLCTWDWNIPVTQQNSVYYAFKKPGTYIVTVTVCYMTYCDYASVVVKVY